MKKMLVVMIAVLTLMVMVGCGTQTFAATDSVAQKQVVQVTFLLYFWVYPHADKPRHKGHPALRDSCFSQAPFTTVCLYLSAKIQIKIENNHIIAHFYILFNTRDLISIFIFWQVKYYLYKFDEVSLFGVTTL